MKPEVFFYSTNVVQRSEAIPISKSNLTLELFSVAKERMTNVVKRVFNKETSVFKAWHPETNSKKELSIELDTQWWKLKKFMNKAGEHHEVITFVIDSGLD